MTKYLQFDVESAEVIEEQESDSQFALAKIRAFSSGKNLHDLVCSDEVLKETAPTIYNKPILYTIDKNLSDFYTHVEPDKSLICGFVVPDSAEFEQLPDGRMSLNVLARIWKRYSPKVIEFFKRDKTHHVSVEMEIGGLKDRPDGFADMLSFVYAGICILGTFVREASPGASMQMVSFSEDQKEYQEAYIAEFANKYDELDFSIPKKVKENAQEGIELSKKYRRGGTSVSLAVARHLATSEKANPEKVRHIEKHFGLHANSDFSNKTGKEFIRWQMYGGNEGYTWSKKLVESMNKIDAHKVAYFDKEGGELMPYAKREDMNPSLKGIDPPISLSQGNAIAKAADAIGTDEKKNGWAIAISQFKKSHTVKDGKWVEKKKEEMADYCDDGDAEIGFAKDDMGKGEAISVDKSKESVSDSAWGSVDKTALRNKILEASNYKSLVNDCYLLVEAGWEDSPSSKLKYPVMQISGGKLVYNRGGVIAALQRAVAQNETSVVSKAKGLESKLGLTQETKDKKEKNMAEDEKDKEKAKEEEEEKKENPEEEKTETPEEEKKENKEEKMSLDTYLDVAATLAFLKSATETADEISDEQKTKLSMAVSELEKEKQEDMAFGAIMGGMYAVMCKMNDKMTKMADSAKEKDVEMAALKEFKAGIEAQQKQFTVEQTLKELDEKFSIPDEARSAMIVDAEKYVFADINVWQNNVRAKCVVDFAVKVPKDGSKPEIKRYAMPFTGIPSKPKNDVWAELK